MCENLVLYSVSDVVSPISTFMYDIVCVVLQQ